MVSGASLLFAAVMVAPRAAPARLRGACESLDARRFWFQPRHLQKRNHVCVEFRIAVEDDVAIWGGLGKRFTQLLDDPLRSRMAGLVEMQDLPPSVFDNEEAVECDGEIDVARAAPKISHVEEERGGADHHQVGSQLM